MIVSLRIRNKFSNSFPLAHVLRGKSNTVIAKASAPFADDIITRAIESGDPTLIGRLGGTEARVLSCYLDVFRGRSLWDPFATIYSLVTFPKRLRQLRNLSGVYPTNIGVIKKFISNQMDALAAADLVGSWGSTFTWVESNFQKSPKVVYFPHFFLAPWVESWPESRLDGKPWCLALEGKKVLVISGFSESFKSQHRRIEKVFPTPLYPKFDAEFVNAPISLGGLSDGRTWVDHLERMKKEMEQSDFEVALISAGAYALPLAHHAKKLGKIGITCGGEMQLFFGVIGKRWEHTEKYTNYRNEYWVRPSESERPSNWREIENGCYW